MSELNKNKIGFLVALINEFGQRFGLSTADSYRYINKYGGVKMAAIKVLEESLGYKFKNIKFLETGVTHSSFSNETKNHVPYNERQEFLGDAVLSIIVSDYIFENYTKLPEGELTKLRASLVCEKSLCGFFRKGIFLLVSNLVLSDCSFSVLFCQQ